MNDLSAMYSEDRTDTKGCKGVENRKIVLLWVGLVHDKTWFA